MTIEFDAETTRRLRAQNSPLTHAFNEVLRAWREHRRVGAKVGDNKATHRVMFWVAELADIDAGVREGKLDEFGYPL